MGAGTFLNATPTARTDENRSARRKASGQVDLPLLVGLIATLIFGLIMLFSASADFSYQIYGAEAQMFLRQLLWLAIGAVVAYVFFRIDYHHWRTLIVPLMVLTIVMLLGVLFVNEVRFGAVRSLQGGSVQPSELAKLVTVIYLGVWMHSKRENLHDVQWGLIPLAVILGVLGGLIYLQPDLSATATILILGGLLFFLAGGDLKQITVLLIVALVVGYVIVQVSPTGQDRINSYIEGLQDPTGAGYHVRRSLEAIVSGGFFGVGLGRAETKLTGLPLAPTDSIFAVVAEELGLFGALMVVSMYGMLLWRGLRIAQKAPDMLGSLLAAGLSLWIALEAAINMLVMVGLMPFAGNALPFFSAGGSNLLVSLAAMGILLNISRQGSEEASKEDDWRSFGATFDLRRRNGRRGVSRVSRS
jgi:cell division protein FtsW